VSIATVWIVAGMLAAAFAAAPSRWERRADMGVPRQEIGLAAVGETLYAVGGFAGAAPSAAVEAYDTRTDRWTAVASLPQPLHHVMAAAMDGVVYAAGGSARTRRAERRTRRTRSIPASASGSRVPRCRVRAVLARWA